MSSNIRRPLRQSLVLAVAASTALLALSSGVHAADDVARIKVSYADLDLSNAADAKRLYQRLRAAANEACNAYDGRELYMVKLKNQCVTTTLNRAVADVNHPALLALHDAREPVKVAQKTGTQPSKG